MRKSPIAIVCFCVAGMAFAAEKPLLVSHRGGRMEFDDNAAGGFAYDYAHGIRGFETDVRMSKDGGMYIMHDDNAERTTDGKGKCCEMGLSQITALKLKKSGEHVPTLQQLADVFKGKKDFRIEWEMKEGGSLKPRDEEYCRKLHDTVSSTLAPGTYVFTSFNENAIRTMKKLFPDAPVGFISGDGMNGKIIAKAKTLGCRFVAANMQKSTAEQVKAAHDAGLFAAGWMVQNPEAYHEAAAKGFDSVTTDFPLKMQSELSKSASR